jgi:hypothetical protein
MVLAREEDRRAYPRNRVSLPARLMLADGHVYPCTIVDVSIGGVAVLTLDRGEIGESVAVYSDATGRLEGEIVRWFDGGFGMKLTGNSHAAEAFARRFDLNLTLALEWHRHRVIRCEVGEPRDGVFELEAHCSGGAMALLADDDLGNAVDLLHLLPPRLELDRPGFWFLVLQVIFFAEHEEHHVRVLLDRSRFAEVGELRALVVAVLHLA